MNGDVDSEDEDDFDEDEDDGESCLCTPGGRCQVCAWAGRHLSFLLLFLSAQQKTPLPPKERRGRGILKTRRMTMKMIKNSQRLC